MRLHVHEWGDPAAPPLVCLHGVTGARRAVQAARGGALGERFHVIAPDLRGHGRSELGAAVDVRDARRRPRRDDRRARHRAAADWVGHSFGGRLVLELAAAPPGARRAAPSCSTRRSTSSRTSRSSTRRARAAPSPCTPRPRSTPDRRGDGPTTPRELVLEDAELHCERLPDGRLRRRTCQPAVVSIYGEIAIRAAAARDARRADPARLRAGIRTRTRRAARRRTPVASRSPAVPGHAHGDVGRVRRGRRRPSSASCVARGSARRAPTRRARPRASPVAFSRSSTGFTSTTSSELDQPGLGDDLHREVRLAVRQAAAHRRADARRVLRVDDVHVEARRGRIRPRRVCERLAHARLDADSVDLAHREHLRVEPAEQLALAVRRASGRRRARCARLDRRQRPPVACERGTAETECGGEHHSVHVPARRRRRRVQVAVRVDPDDAARAVRRRHPDERAERDRMIAAEHERNRVLRARVARRASRRRRTARGSAAETARCRRPPLSTRQPARARCRRPRRRCRASRRDAARSPAYRIAEGPMSTPRRSCPRSSGAPITTMSRPRGCMLTSARLTSPP